MAPVIPTSEPRKLVQGDTWKWRKAVAEFPVSEGWAFRYALRGPTAVDFTATAQPGDYLISVAPSVTARAEPGTYTWSLYAEKGDERYEVDHGVLEVTVNVAALRHADARTHEEKMVAAITARLEQRLEDDVESYGEEGRSAQMIPFAQLRSHLIRYQQAVRMQQNGGRLPGIAFTT